MYRQRRPTPPRVPKKRPSPKRSLTQAQRQAILAEAHSERFADRSPEHIVYTLLEEGHYHCSARTLYRLLAHAGETTPRRRQRKHPPYRRPELMATKPNQTWTWDITLLRGPHRGIYYRLYVVLDLFSRYTVGWLLARTENGKLAARLLRETCEKEGIEQSQLIIHADRGTAATSKKVEDMLDTLGVSRSFSRPRVSDGRVGGWRGGHLRRVLVCVRGFPLRARLGFAVTPFPVPRPSNRTCGSPASGSHPGPRDFALDWS